jgi:hypothetical protein
MAVTDLEVGGEMTRDPLIVRRDSRMRKYNGREGVLKSEAGL